MFACSYAVTALRSYDKVVAAIKGVAAIKEIDVGNVVAAGAAGGHGHRGRRGDRGCRGGQNSTL